MSVPESRYVSRGGEKLAAALDAFPVVVVGRHALDAGASTGGFTDCLLQRGAAHVDAVDVGRGQLAWSLRTDPRVTVRERVNVRALTPDDLGGPVDLAVADLSFISLLTVAPALAACTPGRRRPRAAGEAAVRGGPGPRRARRDRPRPGRARRGAAAAWHSVSRRRASPSSGSCASPLRGADGNVEFLVHSRKGGMPLDPAAFDDVTASPAIRTPAPDPRTGHDRGHDAARDRRARAAPGSTGRAGARAPRGRLAARPRPHGARVPTTT